MDIPSQSLQGSGTDPVLDFSLAPSGEFAIRVGSQQGGTPAQGSLSITGSEDVIP